MVARIEANCFWVRQPKNKLKDRQRMFKFNKRCEGNKQGTEREKNRGYSRDVF